VVEAAAAAAAVPAYDDVAAMQIDAWTTQIKWSFPFNLQINNRPCPDFNRHEYW